MTDPAAPPEEMPVFLRDATIGEIARLGRLRAAFDDLVAEAVRAERERLRGEVEAMMEAGHVHDVEFSGHVNRAAVLELLAPDKAAGAE